MMPGRRKKWSEAEERSLIEKYGEMVTDGTLSKMKTREKKYKPIALYVNSVHHVQDPIAYPWQWSWKDVSTKVQNMRHQYLLVKQKVKKLPPEPGSGAAEDEEEFDWVEGLAHWSNFLRYKEVFGDFRGGLGSGGGDPEAGGDGAGFEVGGDGGGLGLDLAEFEEMGGAGDRGFGAGIDGIDNGVMGLGFGDDDGFVYEEVGPSGVSDSNKKKKASSKTVLKGLFGGKKKRSTWGILGRQLKRLRETEARFEQREAERERERQRREERERERDEREKSREKARAQRVREWEAAEKEGEERARRRREEELVLEREWEERMSRKRAEWKDSMEVMLSRHREEMNQLQNRIIHDQQSLTNQLLGTATQWTAHPAALSDHTSASNQYFSQMMQNLHHVNSLVHDDTRVEGDNQDDQFIVDG